MSGDSMTANHLEHKIATFPGSPGRGGLESPEALKASTAPAMGSATPYTSCGSQPAKLPMTFLPSSQRGKTRLLWRSVGRAGRPEPKNYQKVNALRLPRRRPDRDGAILVDKSCYGTSAPALRKRHTRR